MVTIHDVARSAGVSSTTVSRAVNNPETVSPDTLVRITKAIARLGYAPNRIARSLKVKSSRMVGVIIPDVTNPFLVKVVKGVERALSAAGYTPILCDTEESPDKELHYLRDLMEMRIDGIIFVPVMESRSAVALLKKQDMPAVFVDRYISPDFDCVKSNNISGLSLLVGHLVQCGYHRIAMIGGPQNTPVGHERNDAFRDLLGRYGLGWTIDSMRIGDFTIDGGYQQARSFINAVERPEAIISANNLMGIGALKAIRDAGLVIRRDIDLVVFDELGDVGELLEPPLTFVRQPALEMGAQAASMLLLRIGADPVPPPRTVVFEPSLVSAAQAIQ